MKSLINWMEFGRTFTSEMVKKKSDIFSEMCKRDQMVGWLLVIFLVTQFAQVLWSGIFHGTRNRIVLQHFCSVWFREKSFKEVFSLPLWIQIKYCFHSQSQQFLFYQRPLISRRWKTPRSLLYHSHAASFFLHFFSFQFHQPHQNHHFYLNQESSHHQDPHQPHHVHHLHQEPLPTLPPPPSHALTQTDREYYNILRWCHHVGNKSQEN